MSKFADDLRARIAKLNEQIPNAKVGERRRLQAIRAELERLLSKVEA